MGPRLGMQASYRSKSYNPIFWPRTSKFFTPPPLQFFLDLKFCLTKKSFQPKISGPKKDFVLKFFWSNKRFWSEKKFLVRKIFQTEKEIQSEKKLWSGKKFCSKKFWSEKFDKKIFQSEKNFGWDKKFYAKKKIKSKKCLGS